MQMHRDEAGRTGEVAPRAAPSAPGQSDRSVIDLLRELTQELSAMVRAEMALARTELSEKVSRLTVGLAAFAAAGMALFAGLLTLIAAAVLGLGTVISMWLSALLIGIGVCLIGLVAFGIGQSRLRPDKLKPTQLAREARDEAKFIKEQLR